MTLRRIREWAAAVARATGMMPLVRGVRGQVRRVRNRWLRPLFQQLASLGERQKLLCRTLRAHREELTRQNADLLAFRTELDAVRADVAGARERLAGHQARGDVLETRAGDLERNLGHVFGMLGR